MLFSLLLFSSLAFFIFSFLFSTIKKLKKSNKNSHGGPISYPIIGCLFAFYKNRRRLINWYTDLLSLSPSQTIVIQRLGSRRVIVTANPNNVEYLLKTNFDNYPKGKPFSEILGDLLGNGIFNVDGQLWSSQRKLASHEFSTRSLREFVVKTLKHEVENRLIPLLDEAVREKRVIDLQDVLKRFAFDVVCNVSLGIDPFFLDVSCSEPLLVQAFERASQISAMRGMAPIQLVWKVKRALNLGSEKDLKEAIKVVHGSIREVVQHKKKLIEEAEESNEYSDLLSRLLIAGNDDVVVRDMAISFIIAGRDTTSSAMTWLLWLLTNNDKIEKKIVSEVKSTMVNKYGNYREMDFEALKDMNYLKACICESMRLYPPVAWDSKHAVVDDVLPDGTIVRKGDRVTYFPYGMGRMESLWGSDRLNFEPDRWFEPDSEGALVLKSVSPYIFPVFQAGPRVCLGKEMAFIQMKYVLASILGRFKIRAVSEDPPIFVPLLTAHMAGGFKVVIERRTEEVVDEGRI